MVKQQFHIEQYWEVIVYYNLDYNLFNIIANEMYNAGADEELVSEVYYMLNSNKAKAVTYSNLDKHISIVLFNPHTSKRDYLNSIVHEAEHVKQAMLKVYQVEDKGEPPAYTIGYLVMKMYEVFRCLIFSK